MSGKSLDQEVSYFISFYKVNTWVLYPKFEFYREKLMIKKLTLALLLVLPSYGSAAWGPGPYLGAGVGIDTVDFRQSAAIQRPGDFNAANLTELAAKGILGNIFGGYGVRLGMFYLAAELNASTSSAQFNITNAELLHHNVSQTTYKIDKSWGVGLLPGLLLPETTLLYGRFGYVAGSFQIITNDISLANADTTRNGVRLGLGIEKRLFNNFGARFEYNYISYRNHTESTLDLSSNTHKITTVSPRANQFELDFDYRFYS
jgi:opacity protein-like surface antigen